MIMTIIRKDSVSKPFTMTKEEIEIEEELIKDFKQYALTSLINLSNELCYLDSKYFKTYLKALNMLEVKIKSFNRDKIEDR